MDQHNQPKISRLKTDRPAIESRQVGKTDEHLQLIEQAMDTLRDVILEQVVSDICSGGTFDNPQVPLALVGQALVLLLGECVGTIQECNKIHDYDSGPLLDAIMQLVNAEMKIAYRQAN